MVKTRGNRKSGEEAERRARRNDVRGGEGIDGERMEQSGKALKKRGKETGQENALRRSKRNRGEGAGDVGTDVGIVEENSVGSGGGGAGAEGDALSGPRRRSKRNTGGASEEVGVTEEPEATLSTFVEKAKGKAKAKRKAGREEPSEAEASRRSPKRRRQQAAGVDETVVALEEETEAAAEADVAGTVGTKFRTRCSPKSLEEAIRDMSELQRREVEEMGFKDMLDLQIEQIPNDLAVWLVEAFDPESCSLRLGERGSIRVTERHVERVLGLPRGPKAIELPGQLKNAHGTVKEFRNAMGLPEKGPTPSPTDIKRFLLDAERKTEGGVWSNTSFLVLLVSTMIEASKAGGANLRILQVVNNVSDAKDYNWCGFVIESLRAAKREWADDKKRAFTGPLTFLALLYFESTRIEGFAMEERTGPVLKRWTNERFQERYKKQLVGGNFVGEGAEVAEEDGVGQKVR